MTENNMALLTQSEIDALIEFLNHQKNKPPINGEILSQESINKLIRIVKSAPLLDKSLPLNLDHFDYKEDFSFSDAENIHLYELTFRYRENIGVELFAYNRESAEVLAITPSVLASVSDPSMRWGACMAPIIFDQLAKKLDLRYSEQTFEEVKACFAKVMYGDQGATIPSFYLP